MRPEKSVTRIPGSTGETGDPVVRVLGGYLASVAAAVATLMLLDAAKRVSTPPVPVPDEVPFPDDWIKFALTVGMVLFVVGLSALPPFLLCLAISVRAGIRHPAFHMACGCAIGLVLSRVFSDLVDQTIPAVVAGAVGGAVYWWLAVRTGPGRP